mmetsp:Transcript_39436/g.95424  ORF Transcript_39436/g.95424 Transcript_39436/m.95424 type:complete len:256 (+) Transcript_39436:140-907(+)|eukprot:CAMPEP_0113620174 /NCGR_PEP_ID=MMETSP0017_2-20120614/10269_1 /TAXON_ID=2856 /ORGANISM="Cylindrotheca closterium" /LENGTH=255 /DNA_ID=CAMNT_0000529811 /DNA_START=111 /DNA_END=878 /DNA_ORIENTATION=+ /assembly_acc=CAM_ASM_000147
MGSATVLPGEDVSEIMKQISKGNPKLGIGLRIENNSVFSTVAGSLQYRSGIVFVNQNTRRYRPSVEDRVIAIVEERVAGDGAGGDVYRVNIGGPHPALLSNLSFEGATKRNKPALSSGMLLYARVATCLRSMDPTLSCQLGSLDVGVPRKDWMTNEGTYGELVSGTCCKIPIGLARQLLERCNVVLQELSKYLAFEICVGVNGKVWIHSSKPEHTILIQNAILNSEVLTESQVRRMVKSLVETVNRKVEDRDDEM